VGGRPQVVAEIGAAVAADPTDEREHYPAEGKRHNMRWRWPGHDQRQTSTTALTCVAVMSTRTGHSLRDERAIARSVAEDWP
jgi:hypothetical protein